MQANEFEFEEVIVTRAVGLMLHGFDFVVRSFEAARGDPEVLSIVVDDDFPHADRQDKVGVDCGRDDHDLHAVGRRFEIVVDRDQAGQRDHEVEGEQEEEDLAATENAAGDPSAEGASRPGVALLRGVAHGSYLLSARGPVRVCANALHLTNSRQSHKKNPLRV